MSLWRTRPDLEQLNSAMVNTIGAALDIRFEAFDEQSLTASMVVDQRTHQPYGLLHGGASVVLAETVGSMASYLCVDTTKYYCVGIEVNANHLRSVRSGRVTATAQAVHIGRTTHVWDIRLSSDEGKATCISRLTVAVVALDKLPAS
ncbi:hotdog fold thioesterase [Pseudomonas sp. nanlin1]|uniref:hotdog fold thioesterase n=1 Tax=Pseudomonas sp. nanlin1 TaxID=3040605 RepID=UPI00388D8EFF